MSKPMIKHCQNCLYFCEKQESYMDAWNCRCDTTWKECDVKYKKIPKFLRRITGLLCKYYREDKTIANEYN